MQAPPRAILRRVPVVATWVDGVSVPVDGETLRAVLNRAASEATRPVVVALRSGGAEIDIVVGDSSGTALVYFAPDYLRAATGSMHSLGDRVAAAADAWEPPLVADYFTTYTEYPRWSVVPVELGERALREFLEEPHRAPISIDWGID